MSDRDKVPPPPWATPAERNPTRERAQPPPPEAADGGGARWPSVDDLARDGAGRPTPPADADPEPPPAAEETAPPDRGAPAGAGAAPWEQPRAAGPDPEPIPLDTGRAPQGPRSPYAGADDGAPAEPPPRVPASAGESADGGPPPGRPAPRPAGAARGAASSIIRTEATPMWRIVVVRVVVPVALILSFFTLYNHWTTKSAFKTQVSHDAIMGFDANILSTIEEMAAREGYKLGDDGVQGWILGAERRWIVRVHVRKRALVVIPYYSHFVFEGDLPYNMHVESHLDHFAEDTRWSFDEAIIQTFQMVNPSRPNLRAEVEAMRSRSAPPPR